MAKMKMLCPFTGKECRECAVYRGRHYYFCFRGKSKAEIGGLVKPIARPTVRFEIPHVSTAGILDPFALPIEGERSA